jgi:peptidoglycan/xylan/chitin deacetylase (PgdA/CDA1 family)
MWKQYVKNIAGNTRYSRWAGRKVPPFVVVLMYHDIGEDDDVRSWLRVRESDFIDQLDHFSRIGRFIHLDELSSAELWSDHGIKFLITFDDGFVNNYRLAAPVLHERKIPAAFCVSTEHIVSGDPFWFDRVVTPIQRKGMASLDLEQFGLRRYRFRAEPRKRWDDINLLLVDLKSIGNASHPQVRSIIDHVIGESPDTASEVRERYRPLNADEIREMHDDDLFGFGSHSHKHEILLYQTSEERRRELEKSISVLEGILGTRTELIAYPNGDHDDSVMELCSELGLKYGLSVRSGLYQRGDHPLSIPRVSVGGYESSGDVLYKVNKLLLRRQMQKEAVA